MKKSLLLALTVLFIFFPRALYSFDIAGLQPNAPYNVLSTFSAESLPKGQASFSLGFELSKEPDFRRFLFNAAYGITDTMEFDMTVPYVLDWADRVDGLEDIAIGFRHRFFEERKYGPSVAYILNASLATGRNEFTTEGRYGGGLIVSKRVGPVNGHVNLFYEKPGDSKLHDEVSFLLGLDFSAAYNFKVLAELLCRKSHFSKDFDTIEGRLGYRILAGDFVYTTLGLGFEMRNRSPEMRFMLSLTFHPFKEKKKIRKVYEEE
ncbi:MAG: hypothetical protein FJ243_03205 [Nitrospira sp.]|nr:hypothetical protein [Nitrospira sp.]